MNELLNFYRSAQQQGYAFGRVGLRVCVCMYVFVTIMCMCILLAKNLPDEVLLLENQSSLLTWWDCFYSISTVRSGNLEAKIGSILFQYGTKESQGF